MEKLPARSSVNIIISRINQLSSKYSLSELKVNWIKEGLGIPWNKRDTSIINFEMGLDYLEKRGFIKFVDKESVRLGAYFLESNSLIKIEDQSVELTELDFRYISEQVDKCNDKISKGDFSGSITNARTLVETILVEIRYSLSGVKKTDYDG